MSTVQVFATKESLAHAAAEHAVVTLQASIDDYGNAIWVLAGGSTPLAAYQVIASSFSDALDWSKVVLLLGDERMGDKDGADNNWHAIHKILGSLPTQNHRPPAGDSAEHAATSYAKVLADLPTASNGLPRLDLLWLGVGQDGHTLSLFPSHTSILPSSDLVIPVHDSPKPPRDRISLSLRALQGTQHAVVLTSGADKQAAVQGALAGNHSPIALATSIIETHDGTVRWFVDKDAAPTD